MSSTPGGGDGGAASRCPDCEASRRQRAAAARQLDALTKDNAALTEEVDRLTRELAEAKAELEDILGAAGYDLDGNSLGGGDEEDGEGEGGASSSGGGAAAFEAASRRAAGKTTSSKDKRGGTLPALPGGGVFTPSALAVLTEGDGLYPSQALAVVKPHGSANITSMTAVPGLPGVVVTAGADKTLVVWRWDGGDDEGSSGGPVPTGQPLSQSCVLARAVLHAPALAVSFSPVASGSSTFAVAFMDGSHQLWRLAVTPSPASSSSPAEAGAGAASGTVLTAGPLLRCHSKYVTRLAWSACGRFYATASHDASVALHAVLVKDEEEEQGQGDDASASSVPGSAKLQQLYFSEPADALAWGTAWEEGSGNSSGSGSSGSAPPCLALAVRKAPTLFYVSVAGLAGGASDAEAARRLVPGTRLPVLATAASPEAAPVQEALAAAGRWPSHLLLHRVAISEDGGLDSMLADDAVPQPPDAAGSGGDSEDGAAPALRTGDAKASGVAVAARPDEALVYVPVGFAITDLQVQALPNGRGGVSRVLAAAADNGVVYAFRWGTNAVLRRLAGHITAGPMGTPARLAWEPDGLQYLVATSDRDFAVVVYSVAAQKVLKRLGRGPKRGEGELGLSDFGHTAAIKDVLFLTGADGKPRVLSSSFDKTVIVWGRP